MFGEALDRCLTEFPEADVRFIMTPMVNGLESKAFYDRLVALAAEHQGKFLLIEGMLTHEQLIAIQAGVTWSVWPSLYEPCGGATEPLAVGTPLITRASGGLPRQARLDPSGQLCGLLYRETVPAGVDQTVAWTDLELAGTTPIRLAQPLYVALVEVLEQALIKGVQIRTESPDEYARMLACTTLQVEDDFFSRNASPGTLASVLDGVGR